MNRPLLDLNGPIPRMTPTQALMAIQTMADHSQKWYEGISSRNISSNSNTNGLAEIEVKHLEKVKYREFRRSAPFNGSNRAKFHVEINTMNQSISLKILETQIEQLTKELQSRITNGAPSSSTGQCKVVNADHEMLNIHISSSKLNNLHKVSFLSDSDSQGQTYTEWYKDNSHDNKPMPRDYTFREWMIVKVGHTNVNESVKKALLKSWVIDCFKEALDPNKEPMEISFDDYKWVFDLEIE
ncbi:hypothetical protein Tco_1236713 [Tanacetum coccineum]